MENFDLAKYLDIAFRRRWWIFIVFLLTLLGGLVYVLRAPKVFQAETLILVQPQSVPQDFVRTIVSTAVEDRLNTITQQVTSRTNLEKIIRETDLFAAAGKELLLEEKVALLRRNIKIGVSGGGSRVTNAFTIAFRGADPRKVTDVTNMLASNFMSENLIIREGQAIGTSTFISSELESVKRKLAQKEEELKHYREEFMGGLPEQLQTNLSMLERLQEQADQLSMSLRDLGNRRVLVQSQLTEQKRLTALLPVTAGPKKENPTALPVLMAELAALEAKYTADHPDVIQLRSTIDRLRGNGTGNGSTPKIPESEVERALSRQIQDIDLDISSLKEETRKTRAQIKWYQAKVEDTPKREQELLGLNRDYQNLKDLYDSLLKRKLEADLAVSMERKQKGEQFRVIDRAKIPIRPVEPDIPKAGLIILAFGLALGGGVAYLIEVFDTSYKNPDELEKELRLPVLVSMSFQRTPDELRRFRLTRILAASSVLIAFVASALTIVLTIKGYDRTVEFIRDVFVKT